MTAIHRRRTEPRNYSRGTLMVLFDGSCPLCRREIGHYRQLRPRCPVLWSDISTDSYWLEQFDIPHERAMASLHVIDRQGNTVQGAAAFLCLWEVLPGYRYLAAAINRARLSPLLERIYQRFARWRQRRRCPGQCRR